MEMMLQNHRVPAELAGLYQCVLWSHADTNVQKKKEYMTPLGSLYREA